MFFIVPQETQGLAGIRNLPRPKTKSPEAPLYLKTSSYSANPHRPATHSHTNYLFLSEGIPGSFLEISS